MNDPVWDKNYAKLVKISKAFYQAYRLSGTVKMKFDLRWISDSDGNSVIDVFLSPLDQEAADTLKLGDSSRHMQFLESMVPASLMGYQFILRITPAGVDDIELELIETMAPLVS